MIRKLLSYRIPQNLILTIDIMAILLLSFYGGRFDSSVLLLGALLALIIYVSNYALLKISPGDHYVFLIISMLVSIGVIVIYRLSPEYGFRQIKWFGVGIAAYFAFYFFTKYMPFLRKWTTIYAALSFALFLATLVLGVKIKGSTNWIQVAGYSFQPTEFIKILLVFLLASYYSLKKKPFNQYWLLGIIYAFIGFLFIQRDLGTVMIFYFVFMTVFYIFEEDRRLVYYNILGALLIGIAGYFAVSHVQVRVTAWLEPWKYADSMGYQIIQSLIAIASGGFFGTGIGLGHPEFIPEVHTDFIFSAICEEMGILGGIGVIMLFMILVYRGFKIALNQDDRFFKIIALGITTILGFQAFIIIGGVIKMIPLTGVTLPFVSYGGSSLISSFAALGILQVASEKQKAEQEEYNG